jgi:hypothetical protein
MPQGTLIGIIVGSILGVCLVAIIIYVICKYSSSRLKKGHRVVVPSQQCVNCLV